MRVVSSGDQASPNFVTKYGTKQGVLVLGKVLPFGFGAAIGMTGNAAMSRMVVRTTRSAFGPLLATGTTAESLPSATAVPAAEVRA